MNKPPSRKMMVGIDHPLVVDLREHVDSLYKIVIDLGLDETKLTIDEWQYHFETFYGVTIHVEYVDSGNAAYVRNWYLRFESEPDLLKFKLML